MPPSVRCKPGKGSANTQEKLFQQPQESPCAVAFPSPPGEGGHLGKQSSGNKLHNPERETGVCSVPLLHDYGKKKKKKIHSSGFLCCCTSGTSEFPPAALGSPSFREKPGRIGVGEGGSELWGPPSSSKAFVSRALMC